MFSKQYRLPPNTPLAKGSIMSTPYFTMKFLQNSLATNRYGFVVSKRIDKRATARNRIKRQVRSCVEQLHPTLSQGFDILFIIKRAVDVSHETLQQAVEQTVTKAKLL